MAMEAWVELDVGVLRNNLRRARAALSPSTALIFVVKANAYGHGLLPVARTAFAEGITHFAVMHVDEAWTLRRALPEAHILVMGATTPLDVAKLIQRNVTTAVVDREHARALGAAARRCGGKLSVHIKLDTGMGRIGFPWLQAAEDLPAVAAEPALDVCGIYSHFAVVEPSNLSAAEVQVERFRSAARLLPPPRSGRLLRHLSNSRGFLLRPDWDFDGVRPGIALYGYGAQDARFRFQTRPCLQWKTLVHQVKTVPAGTPVGYYARYVTETETDLATLPVGYADGFSRLLSNRGHVLIGGRPRPVAGRVSMNWITVDLGPGSGVKAGDEVVLIGQQGGEQLWADKMAAACKTIPHEILVGLRPRLRRIQNNTA